MKRGIANIVCFLFLIGCSDPVKPEFRFKENLIYIESLASTAEGVSYAVVLRSVNEFGVFKNKFISDASVFFINGDTGAEIPLRLDNELYVPPTGFATKEGETWKLKVHLSDGTDYESESETVVKSVPIDEVKTTYNPELFFSPEYEKFVPGHTLSVGFLDPPGEKNYYYWRFRSFEKLVNCRVCFASYLREDACESVPPANPEAYKPYYTYACESDCWQIRYGDKIEIFSDEFTDGIRTSNLPVAQVLLNTKKNILIELQQFAISEKAYEYYRTLKDIINNNAGFNSPLPAALVGNMFNPNNSEEFVLGRFTAAATTTNSIWVERTFIVEEQLVDELLSQPEGFGEPTPVPQVYSAPCDESRIRTGLRPQGWID